MNRPHARNALGNVFVSEVSKGTAWCGQGWARTDLTLFVLCPPQLLEALAQLREDQQVRVLLFRSAVKGVFCAGGFPTTPPPQGLGALGVRHRTGSHFTDMNSLEDTGG